MAAIHTTAAETPLLDLLAQRLLARYAGDPLLLSRVLVLLPSRRACLALRDQLSALADTALLLPRIRPIGEADEAEAISDALWRHPDIMARLRSVPPAIDQTSRMLAVAKELWRMSERFEFDLPGMEPAARLATDILGFIDELDRERIDYHAVDSLPPENYAEHWQKSLGALNHILHWWPGYLAEQRLTTPLKRRNALLEILADHWQSAPPDYPVIAAGSTGTHPATADLLAVIANLPQGEVILSGLDRDCSDACWDLLAPTHPQYQLKRLLEKLGIVRRDVSYLGEGAGHGKSRLLLDACAPAELTGSWMQVPQQITRAITRIDCEDEHEEAEAVTLLLRETMQETNKTVALITHDLALIRRVQASLARHGMVADNAAGQPITAMPAMRWLRLVAEAAIQADSPLALLALIKHPFCIVGDVALKDALIDLIERRIVRGLRRKAPWIRQLQLLSISPKVTEEQKAGLEYLFNILSPLCTYFAVTQAPAEQLLDAHLQAAIALAGQGVADKDIIAALDQWRSGLALLGVIESASYVALLIQSLSSIKCFPKNDTTPRLYLLRPIEARLLHFDRVVLAGLNETCWPGNTHEDGWLNPAMRAQLGLPPADAAIGQQAHDFILSSCSGECIVTRARRSGGAETLPSRWLTRLDAMQGISASQRAAYGAHRVLHWLRELAEVEQLPPAPHPAPNPPLAARPRRLSVTQMERLLRDPYGIYAQMILKLRPLEEMESPDAALRGSVIHEILERFVRAVNQDPEQLTRAVFGLCARDVLRDYADWPLVTLFWTPRIEQMADWVVALERERREQASHILPEYEAEAVFDGLVIHGRIDRLEEAEGGWVTIVDYKTGEVPPTKAITLGYACQLPLLAMILNASGRGKADRLEYWKLGSGLHKPEIKPVNADLADLLAFYDNGIRTVARRYLLQGQPYCALPVPAFSPSFNDYALLARIEQ